MALENVRRESWGYAEHCSTNEEDLKKERRLHHLKRTEFARVQATASHPKKRSVHDPQHFPQHEKRPEFRPSGRLWTIAGAGNEPTRRYRSEAAKVTICR